MFVMIIKLLQTLLDLLLLRSAKTASTASELTTVATSIKKDIEAVSTVENTIREGQKDETAKPVANDVNATIDGFNSGK